MSGRQKAVIETDSIIRTVDLTRPSNTTQYTAGDVIGAVTTDGHFEFTNVTEAGGGGVTILGAQLIGSADNTGTLAPDLELWLFDTDIADRADNLAFIPTDAEMKTLIGVIDFPSTDVKVGLASGNITCRANKDDLPLDAPELPSTSIFGVLVLRNAYTPSSAEVFTIRLKMQRDNPKV